MIISSIKLRLKTLQSHSGQRRRINNMLATLRRLTGIMESTLLAFTSENTLTAFQVVEYSNICPECEGNAGALTADCSTATASSIALLHGRMERWKDGTLNGRRSKSQEVNPLGVKRID